MWRKINIISVKKKLKENGFSIFEENDSPFVILSYYVSFR